jgi:hypothetical protein
MSLTQDGAVTTVIHIYESWEHGCRLNVEICKVKIQYMTFIVYWNEGNGSIFPSQKKKFVSYIKLTLIQVLGKAHFWWNIPTKGMQLYKEKGVVMATKLKNF